MKRRLPNKRRLNDQVIKRLVPSENPYLVWDTVQRGLAVRVETSGYRSFKIIYSRHGKPRWYSIGPCDVVSIDAARLKAGKVMVAVLEGSDPAADRKAERTAGTFGELANKYVEVAKKKNKSWQQADKLVKRHLLPRWGKLPIASITRSDVKTVMGKIAAPVMANQVLAAASAIFAWGVREELTKVNPCVGVERNKTKARERVLSDGELPQFWKEFDDRGMEGFCLKVILLTGQRPGEVRHMRTEHVVDGWWEMPGDPVSNLNWPGTKNAASHRVWLPQVVQEMIEGADGSIFAGPRGKVVRDIDVTMKSICKKLGVERATPHDLRRTHGSTITALGFGRDGMNRIQNHVEGGIASVYDRHQYAAENKRIMETVASKILSVVEGVDGNVVAFRK